ncbi:MAG: MarR family transcriptional regulator [Micromonosporaceae bacterium]|nr:MarR family transcriptional regulator [Micromonosporaceae bacterium]
MGKPLDLPFDPIERAAARWDSEFGPSTAMKVATSIMRVHQLLLARYDEILRPYELTFARYEALVLLAFSRRGELPMRVIGERLMVHPTSATNIIERLTRQAYVRRKRNPADGRGVLAAITPEGRSVVGRATKDLMAAGFGLDALDAGQCEDVFAALRQIRLAAGDFTAPDTARE